MYILLVTWIISGQPPNSYQQTFESLKSCANAKVQIEVDAARMKWQLDQKNAELEKGGVHVVVSGDPPMVSAVCAPR